MIHIVRPRVLVGRDANIAWGNLLITAQSSRISLQVVAVMSGQWRTLLVKDDEYVNASIVEALRKDGYVVQGVVSIADAMRVLWVEEYDVVISDVQSAEIHGLELLQWLRTYRLNTRVILVGPANSEMARSQALEGGAASYLEKPLNLHQLKEELRRLWQQTGFSANLDSFDLLDVIQIITMSRKNIALLVNIGVEERGMLGFLEGELVWAEYGMLRGEEAFFALAAHKNGTVMHQAWSGNITPNVTQPLSRLIFQSLQYRTKYAQQFSGEQVALPRTDVPHQQEVDDSPFQVLAEYDGAPFGLVEPFASMPVSGQGIKNDAVSEAGQAVSSAATQMPALTPVSGQTPPPTKEWWQQTSKVMGINESTPLVMPQITGALGTNGNTGEKNMPPDVAKMAPEVRRDLPSWLTDQPTSATLSAVRPSSLSGTSHLPTLSSAKASSPEWQPPNGRKQTTGPIARKDSEAHANVAPSAIVVPPTPRRSEPSAPSPEWDLSERGRTTTSGPLQSLAARKLDTPAPVRSDSGSQAVMGVTGGQRSVRRSYNYPALVAALQTLGYAVNGFIAAAVVTLEGLPIAQVAVDDLDISRICKPFSAILKSVLQSLDQGAWGDYEDTVITSADRHVIMSLVGSDKKAFQVLITTRESDPVESLNVMANVENAITAALQE